MSLMMWLCDNDFLFAIILANYYGQNDGDGRDDHDDNNDDSDDDGAQ